MRVLLVSSNGADLFYGGAERYVHDLRVGLEAVGHEVAVLSAFPTKADDSPVLRVLHRSDWHESRTRRYRNHLRDWIAPASASLGEVVRELRPDIVHTNNLPGISTGIWEQARILGLPVVHTLHDYHLLCPRTSLTQADGAPCRPHPLLCGLRSRRMARWLPGVDAVIGVSGHVLDRHEDIFPPSLQRHVIRPPLVPIIGGVQAPSAASLTTLGYIGTLTADKGIRVVLEAAARLAEQGVRVRVAGGGPLQDEVRAAEGVEYEGRLAGQELASFLRTCDVGVVASLWEEPGLSFAALEWLSAGRPVLTTGRGGLAELSRFGGVVSYDATAAGLVATVGKLRVPERWQAISAAVPVVEDDRDLQRWVDAHRAIYDQVRKAA
ncbi:MAG: glycosyltransferase [Actinomycetota bacterium]|nr:glycosyltransferase [Actinomycetota bacterium]